MTYRPTPEERAVFAYFDNFDLEKYHADVVVLKSRIIGGSTASSIKAGGPACGVPLPTSGRNAEGALCLTSRI
jgi:hypothetical protein